MNLKKILLSLTTVMVFVVFILGQSVVYASKSETQWMGIQALMSDDPKFGYAINDPTLNNGGVKIWNLVVYPNGESDNTYTNNHNIYCLKEGQGFTNDNGLNQPKQQYDYWYNMRIDRNEIKNSTYNDTVKGFMNKTLTIGDKQINQYNAVLAVLDMLYLPATKDSTDAEKKELEIEKKKIIYNIIQIAKNNGDNNTENIAKAFEIPEDVDTYYDFIMDYLTEQSCTQYDLTEYALTDEEIVAVQQAALWYFTNYGEERKGNANFYDNTTNNGWFYYTTDGNNYQNMTNYRLENEIPNTGTVGEVKSYQAEILYNYIIETAKANASKYAENSSSISAPATVMEGDLTSKTSKDNNNYIVGPIKITENESNSIPYTIDFTVKNGTASISNYTIVDENETTSDAATLVKEGKEIYISIPKNSVSDVNSIAVDITIQYHDTTMKLWVQKDSSNEQPLVEITRETTPVTKTLKMKEEEKEFDLKLVKYISAVNGDTSNGKTVTKIDTTKLASGDATTADYTLSKEPVNVKIGDYVTYTFRVYNEGDIDGYVTKLTDNVPLGLQFVSPAVSQDGKTITIYNYDAKTGLVSEENKEVDEATYKLVSENNSYWTLDQTTNASGNRVIKTDTYDGDTTTSISVDVEDYLGGTNKLLNAYDASKDTNKDGSGLSYVDVTVVLRVSETAPMNQKIRNEAAITGDLDKDGNDVEDRDSKPEEWPGKDDHDKYQDDEDYDNVILQSFDLALRKFIVAVSNDTKIENSEYLKNEDGSYTREPIVDTSKLNTLDENGKLITTATYNHTKEPLIVQPNDVVIYMLRVYNEGDTDGYASEIKDHLPPYLEFVEDEFNKQYGWEVSEDGRTVTTRHLENSIIKKAQTDANGKIELSYKEVPIMCRVKETSPTNEKITNIADITEYLDENKKPAVDRDSQEDNVKLPEDKDLPSYKDDETGSYIPGQQDDDDFEKVIVKTFDLALRKWVTEAIVIENGQQTITQTGHDAWDDPEDVVKVEIHRKKLNQVAVKFRYSIRVYNQGDIEGYAKEVTDYIPEGLKFLSEDNPGWTDEGDNVISTKLLENTLLKPGEYADVEVVLTWINNEDNMGVMTNTAEISEDYNEYGVPDKDSTPDNRKEGEDDIDDAPVMLSISTGQVRIYFTLGFIVLITIASGVILIKKFVL